MIDKELIASCLKEAIFKADNSLYRFWSEDPPKSHYVDSWYNHQGRFPELKEVPDWRIKDIFEGASDFIAKQGEEHMHPMLFDYHNCDLYDNVRPINWTDPEFKVKNSCVNSLGLV